MSSIGDKELKDIKIKAAKDALLAAAATVHQMGKLVVWDQKGIEEFLIDCAEKVEWAIRS
jgi:hypothetical protein